MKFSKIISVCLVLMFVMALSFACSSDSEESTSFDSDGEESQDGDGDFNSVDGDKTGGDLELVDGDKDFEEAIPEEPPVAPEDISAKATSPHNIAVYWKVYQEQDVQVVVERKTALQDEYVEISRRLAQYGRFLDLALEELTGYSYRLKACRADQCSDYVETGEIATIESVLPEIIIEHEFKGEDNGEVFLLNAKDFLDGDNIYSALMAIKRDGTIVWALQDIEGGTVLESHPLEDHTIMALPNKDIAIMDLDGTRLYEYNEEIIHHDIDVTSDGNFIYLYWEEVPVDENYSLLGDGIHILNPLTGNILWEWAGKDHVPFTDVCEECVETIWYGVGHDWLHANSVTFNEEESAIYMNARNLNRIYKIKYPSGEIEWIMGDGGDFGEGLWSHSHDPVFMEEGKVLIFDNGLHREKGEKSYSRLIMVDYDEDAKTAEISWEYREDPDFYSFGFGGVAETQSGIVAADAQSQRVVEANVDSEKIWEIKYKGKGFLLPFKVTVLNDSFFSDWGAPPRDYGWTPAGGKSAAVR